MLARNRLPFHARENYITLKERQEAVRHHDDTRGSVTQ